MVKKLLGGTGFGDQMQGIQYNFDKNDINVCHVMSIYLTFTKPIMYHLDAKPHPLSVTYRTIGSGGRLKKGNVEGKVIYS